MSAKRPGVNHSMPARAFGFSDSSGDDPPRTGAGKPGFAGLAFSRPGRRFPSVLNSMTY